MRRRYGLHRLRQALQVSAVSAAAITVSAAALAAAPTHGMQRFVWVFRQQRRVPGRGVWLAYGLVWHAGTVRLWHGLHRLRTALLPSAVAATLTTATLASSSVTASSIAASAFAATTLTTSSLTTALASADVV